MREIEGRIYELYQGQFKEIYADLCAVRGNKPAQLVFEIEAVLSHLVVAKTHNDTEIVNTNIRRAQGHIERATLDAAKMLWLEYRGRLVRIVNNENLRKYCVNRPESEFVRAFQSAEDKAKEARKIEISSVGVDPMTSVTAYYEAASDLRDALGHVDPAKVASFKKFSFGHIIKTQTLGFVLGIAAGVIASLICTKFIS